MNRDRAVLLRALGVMFNAGIPINRALAMLAEQFPGDLGAVCQALTRRIESGTPLHKAVAAHPEVFSRLQIKMLEVGMRTGGLGQVLQKMADYEEKQLALRARARSALTYPAIVFLVCMVMVVFLPPYLFRDLFRMLEDSDTQLPGITKVVILVSEMVRAPWFVPLLIAGVAALVVAGPKFLARQEVRYKLFDIALWLRGVGPALKALSVCRFARALDTMAAVGIPLHESLHLAGQATDNPVLERAADRSVEHVLEGMSISEALQETGFFPPLFVQSVKVGEEGGKLGDALTNVAEIYELELDSRLDTMTALLEPVVMAVIGVCVGFTVVATLLPLSRFIEQI